MPQNRTISIEKNMGRYLKLAQTEDIFITKNGKVAAKLTNPFNRKIEIAKLFLGKRKQSISCCSNRKD